MNNYDGPSFYRKKEEKQSSVADEDNLEKGTPLEQFEKEMDTRSSHHFFRSKQIPKSLQNLEGWKKEHWSKEFVSELEQRLKKESSDYLLFSTQHDEEVEKNSKPASKATKEIQDKVAEIENTLDRAASARKEIKPKPTKPNTGLHRTLSKIISEDEKGLKNRKNNLASLFSEEK